MNTLIVNKTEQTATEQLFYFPGILPPRQLRCINNRLVVENHKTLMEVLYEPSVKLKWEEADQGLDFASHHLSSPTSGRPASGGTAGSWKALGMSRFCFPAEQGGLKREQQGLRSPVPQHTRHSARDSRLPQRRAELLSSFPPCSLTQPTA